jgi:hypothetical protein
MNTNSFQFLTQHKQIIYPALALLVLVLLVAAVLNAWKSPEIAGAEKARLKGEIIRFMRKHIGWATAAEVGAGVEVETQIAATLMQEMKDDGLLITAMMDNLLHYRLKGT